MAWTPILATAVVVAVSGYGAQWFVNWLDHRNRAAGLGRVSRPKPEPFALSIKDVPWFLAGFMGQFVSAVLQDAASVWSYFIDLGAFAAATILIVTYRANSVARIFGLAVMGIHVAQIVVSSDNSPFHGLVEATRDVFDYTPRVN